MYLFDEPQRRRKNLSPELKKDLFKTQNGKCMYCGRKPGIDLMDVDHKNPMAKCGSDQKRNLQLLCRTCNTREGATTDRQFRTKFKAAGVPTTQTPPTKPIPQSRFDQTAKRTADTKAKRARNTRTAKQRDPFGFSNYPDRALI